MGHFEKGVWVEDTLALSAEQLATAVLQVSHQQFEVYNREHPPGGAIVWINSSSGGVAIYTPDPKYAKKLLRFTKTLK
jgi:hypothetical protein